jgi:hypothetical protein
MMPRVSRIAMPTFIILAAMKGRFVSQQGNHYDNFQMLGYVEAGSPGDAVTTFFDQTPYPIQWSDVEYLWAEELAESSHTGHHGDYDRVYVESLRQRWNQPPSGSR